MNSGRTRALIVLGVLAVIALGSVAWAFSTDKASSNAASGCVKGGAPFDATVPTAAKAVRVKVFNSTQRAGLAGSVATQLRARKFTVLETGNDTNKVVTSSAEIRYGAAGAGGAQLLRSYVDGATLVLDTRTDKSVDLVLGLGYRQLAAPAAQVAALKGLGAPARPAELCR
jgi:hypothetical protein